MRFINKHNIFFILIPIIIYCPLVLSGTPPKHRHGDKQYGRRSRPDSEEEDHSITSPLPTSSPSFSSRRRQLLSPQSRVSSDGSDEQDVLEVRYSQLSPKSPQSVPTSPQSAPTSLSHKSVGCLFKFPIINR